MGKSYKDGYKGHGRHKHNYYPKESKLYESPAEEMERKYGKNKDFLINEIRKARTKYGKGNDYED